MLEVLRMSSEASGEIVKDPMTGNEPENEGLLVKWRRTQVLERLAKGHSQSKIAKDLAVSESTIFRDVRWLKQTIECDMHEQTRNLMFQRNVSLHGIKLLIFELWQMLERTQDISERMSIVDRISKLYQ